MRPPAARTASTIFSGDRPGVEACRALRLDRLERRGEIVERDVIAGLRRAAVGLQIDARGRGMLGKNRRGGRQRVGDVVIDGQALPGERDRGRDEVGETKFSRAVIAPGELEPRDRPGHADGEARPARFERVGLAVGVEKDVLGRRGGGRLAIVDRDGLAEVGAMDQHEAAAAEIAGARQRHRKGEADRDRRVDRVASAPEHVEPDPRGGRLLAHDHAMPGDDRPGGGEVGDDRRRIGERRGRDEQKESEGDKAERFQGSGLQTMRVPTRSP